MSSVLALGANTKNTFSISTDKYIFISQYIGNMNNLESLKYYKKNVNHFKNIYNINPKIIAYDNHPNYWHKTDRDMKLYTPYGENKTSVRMAFDIEHVFEFDTVVGDLTPATYEFDAAAYTEGIVEGIITCTFDGCIDDRISEQNDGETRDIRISIGERDDSPIRGVYAALFDIDDSYDLTTNEKCQSLVTNGITSFTVKNNYTYPCLYDDGNYVLNDEIVEIEIEFDADKDFKVKSRERFNLNITLDKDANLQHEDLVFSVGKSFSGGDFIDGEITIGLVDS
jgi:hypothetical protein